MKKIVIIGNSLAGIKAAEEIRKYDPSSEITVLALEENLPSDRHAFAALVAKDISKQHIFYHPPAYYQKLKIHFVTDKKLSRVNFKRNRIFTGDSTPIAYDFLIIADTDLTAFPEIKGVGKSGSYALRRFCDLQELTKNLLLIDTIVIQSETLSGLKMACALNRIGKEVIWITADTQLLPSEMKDESSQILCRILEEDGIRIMTENAVAEILGDIEVKAVRLKSGKVLASQAVVFTDLSADLKMFKDTALEFHTRIPVNDHFQTNLANVFAVDGVCDFSNITNAEQQGTMVARTILNSGNSDTTFTQQPVAAEERQAENFFCPVAEIKTRNSLIHFIGKTQVGEGLFFQNQHQPEEKIYRKFFLANNRVIGAVLINCGSEKEKIIQLVKSQLPLTSTEEVDPHAEIKDADRHLSMQLTNDPAGG